MQHRWPVPTGFDATATPKYVASTEAAFTAALSVGDNVAGIYQPTGTSTFVLDNAAPSAVTNLAKQTANGVNVGKAGVQIGWTDPTTNTTVASYNVYRGTAIQPTIVGTTVACPAASAFAKIGSVTDTSALDAAGAGYTFFDGTAVVPAVPGSKDPAYCYKVTAVDVTGGESAAVTSDVLEANAATTAATLKFQASTVDTTGTSLALAYSVAVNSNSVQAGDYTVEYTPAGSSTSYALVVTLPTTPVTGSTVTLTVALPTGVTPANKDTYLVTARNGSDGDTVTSGSGTSMLTQAAGNQVLITQAGIGI